MRFLQIGYIALIAQSKEEALPDIVVKENVFTTMPPVTNAKGSTSLFLLKLIK
jgi:hypothetical protein